MNKGNILSSYEDEGVLFLKGQDNEALVKGRKADPLGTKKTFGDKEYLKTASGWKAIGKNSGKAKDAHDFVHGEKKENGDIELSAKNIGKKVSWVEKDVYDKESNSYKDFTVTGKIDSLLIDINDGAYGLKVKPENLPYKTNKDYIQFLDKNNLSAKNAIGENLKSLKIDK